MRNKSLKLSIFFLILALLSIFSLKNENIVDAQRGRCGNQTPCIDPNIGHICLPLPTTLPAVSPTSNGYGFQPASSNCGARRCYYLFSCVCGPALGAGVCYSVRGGVSSCDKKDVLIEKIKPKG